MNELHAAVYAKLTSAAGLTALLASATSVYHQQAPDGATYPFVVWSIQAGGDENIISHRMKNLILFVRAYALTSAKDAGAIDAQIDAALHGQALAVTGWRHVWMAREQDLELVEGLPNGKNAYMAGGNYRVRLQTT